MIEMSIRMKHVSDLSALGGKTSLGTTAYRDNDNILDKPAPEFCHGRDGGYR